MSYPRAPEPPCCELSTRSDGKSPLVSGIKTQSAQLVALRRQIPSCQWNKNSIYPPCQWRSIGKSPLVSGIKTQSTQLVGGAPSANPPLSVDSDDKSPLVSGVKSQSTQVTQVTQVTQTARRRPQSTTSDRNLTGPTETNRRPPPPPEQPGSDKAMSLSLLSTSRCRIK